MSTKWRVYQSSIVTYNYGNTVVIFSKQISNCFHTSISKVVVDFVASDF